MILRVSRIKKISNEKGSLRILNIEKKEFEGDILRVAFGRDSRKTRPRLNNLLEIYKYSFSYKLAI